MDQLRTLIRLAPWVFGSVVVSILGLCVSRQVIDRELLRPSNDVLGNYLQTLGSIYAVLLAFVVYAVWQQFNEARAQVEREASEITELFRITQALPKTPRRALQGILHAYCCGVLDGEWAAMAQRNGEREIANTARLLDDMWCTLQSFEPSGSMESLIVSEAMDCFNELCTARTTRLSTSRLRIPRGLRWVLYGGAVVLMCSTWLFAVDTWALHAWITGTTGGALAHVLYVVEDLDDCFHGDWQVPRTAFERAREFMRERVDRASQPA
jgi:hypothetical protein